VSELEAIRLDKWLWAARFFKTRKLAAEAIFGGKVHVNEQRAKPGKEVKIGAMLSISKDNYRWEITILAINGQRRSAKEAVCFIRKVLKVLPNVNNKSFKTVSSGSCSILAAEIISRTKKNGV
jgi:Ribosome-associated heat shock protein implicated in the recycling of the 50S subunit (S4 paralog)